MKSVPPKTDPRVNPVKSVPPKTDPRVNPVKSVPPKTDPRVNPVKSVPPKMDPRVNPVKSVPPKTDPRVNPVKSLPPMAGTRMNPVKNILSKADPGVNTVESVPSKVLKAEARVNLANSVPPIVNSDETMDSGKENIPPTMKPSLDTSCSAITISSSPVKRDENEWLQYPHLFLEDKNCIVENRRLTCRVIDACQELLKKIAFTKAIDGWQSVTNGVEKIKQVKGDFVQIFLVKNSHWITVSNIRCELGCVCIYDSYYPSVDTDTQLKVCSLLKARKLDSVTFNMANIQKQSNSVDCGLFAIASATELSLMRDPCLCHWDDSQFRPHLVRCLEEGKLRPFPLLQRLNVRFGKRYLGATTIVEVCCMCRMPSNRNQQLVKCEKCPRLLHMGCAPKEADTVLCNACSFTCGVVV